MLLLGLAFWVLGFFLFRFTMLRCSYLRSLGVLFWPCEFCGVLLSFTVFIFGSYGGCGGERTTGGATYLFICFGWVVIRSFATRLGSYSFLHVSSDSFYVFSFFFPMWSLGGVNVVIGEGPETKEEIAVVEDRF